MRVENAIGRHGLITRLIYESIDIILEAKCVVKVIVGFLTISFSPPFQTTVSKFVYCTNRTSYDNFKLKLCTCAHLAIMLISLAWNYHHKSDFWHRMFSREYFGELAKRYLNIPSAIVLLGKCHSSIPITVHPALGVTKDRKVVSLYPHDCLQNRLRAPLGFVTYILFRDMVHAR